MSLTHDQIEVLQSVSQATGFYFDTKAQKVTRYQFSNLAETSQSLKQLVITYLNGHNQPKLLNGELAHKWLTSRKFDQQVLDKFWFDANSFNPFGLDPYIQYFWQQCPSIEDIEPELMQIYQPLYQSVDKNILSVEE